jgi:methylenetetrahydrofolate reductase (NADPH)
MFMTNELVAPVLDSIAIKHLAAGFSLEISARDAATIDDIAGVAAPGSDVYVPWIPGDHPEDLVRVAARLRAVSMNPVPHVPARHLRSQDELANYLARAADDAGVTQVLLIGGDARRPVGPFETSRQVLETGLFERAGITSVGLAGHPEGHPHVTSQVLLEALEGKVKLARSIGMRPYIVSQFCFKAEPILNWLSELKRAGLDVDIRIGLAGPASIATLMRFALRCGVGNSVRALVQQGPGMARLFTEPNPEHIIRSVMLARVTAPIGDVVGFHFFPFGGLKRLGKWLRDASNSRSANACG